jgi:hypothetical protein
MLSFVVGQKFVSIQYIQGQHMAGFLCLLSSIAFIFYLTYYILQKQEQGTGKIREAYIYITALVQLWYIYERLQIYCKMRIIILGGFRNTLAQDFGAHFLLFPWFYFSF